MRKKSAKKEAKKSIEPNFLVKFNNKREDFGRSLQIYAVDEQTAWLWVGKQKEEWRVSKDTKVEVVKL